jgi:hypothetical protein
MALISKFDFEINHIKGKYNKVVNVLSRNFQTINLTATSVGGSDTQQRIETLLQEDKFFNQVKETLQQRTMERKYEGYQLRTDGL